MNCAEVLQCYYVLNIIMDLMAAVITSGSDLPIIITSTTTESNLGLLNFKRPLFSVSKPHPKALSLRMLC